MNQKRMQIRNKLIEYVEKYNSYAPFPIWDTELVEELKELEVNYDDEPVECCKYCKNLHIIEDEDNNDVCFKCKNVVNDEVEKFDNIHDYLDKYGDIWGLKKD